MVVFTYILMAISSKVELQPKAHVVEGISVLRHCCTCLRERFS